MLDRGGPFGRRSPWGASAGRRPIVVVALLVALLGAPLAVVGWMRTHGGRSTTTTAVSGHFDPNVIRAAAVPAAPPVTEPPVTTTVPAPEPAPSLVSVPGSKLRRGVAGPISSPATVADVKVAKIGLYSTPGQAEADDSFSNPTWEGLPLVFLVQQRQGDWLQVQLNTRPNQTTAWIRAADVSLRQTSHRIVVSLASRTLTVYDGQSQVMEASVAIGDPTTPTPRGNYYIDGAVRTPDPSGVYGPFQLSVAAFSEVLMSFGSGVGQIAMHGTNAPGLIGSAVSNGCLRMTNVDVTRLANTVEIGTPVSIS
jgi:lipoprotein-anchoring transpeptidase ErfK/SrfK